MNHHERVPVLATSVREDVPFRMIPWAVHEEAWRGYSKVYGIQQSASRVAERGGFSPKELDEYAPGWREKTLPPTEAPTK